MKNARILTFAAVALMLCTHTVFAAGGAAPLAQYIVVLKAASRGAAPAPQSLEETVASLGGTVDFRRADRIVVSIPEAAVEAMSAHPRVKYLQKVITGSNAASEDSAAQPARTRRAAAVRPLAVTTPPSWSSGTYSYDGSGNIIAIGSDSFLYDGVMRLKSATVSGHAEEYGYDAFGNMKSKKVGEVVTQIGVQPDTNRLTSWAYDVAGNITGLSVGAQQYWYDGFNLMSKKFESSNNATELYLYTADDERIGVVVPNDKITWSIRDVEGKVLRQYQSDYANPQAPWLWIEDYVYRDSQMLASDRMPEEGGRRQFHLDHLGTPRLVTSPSGMQSSVHDYAPFGTELTPSNQDTAAGFDRAEPKQFTGHERDYTVAASSGGDNYVDYMHARYYSPAMGRFLSIDPANSSESSGEPQSWNRYSYARNNPVALVDRNGKWPSKVVHTHQNAIEFTLRALPAHDRQVLKDAQVTADVDQQHQYKHAMRNPGQSPHDAAVLANKFIDAALGRAVELEKAGNHDGALLNVGLAMHTLQDNTSPTHIGIQMFDPNNGSLSGPTIAHVLGELDDPSGLPRFEAVGENLDRATYDAYAYFANATGLPVPPVPDCDGKPCFQPSGETHVDVPPEQ